ncbi:hypothetical protein JCM11251_007985 [Rhodosporidiobolus azoricus]
MPAPKMKGARKATRYRAREAEPEKQFDRSHSRLRGNEARMQTYDDVMELGGDEDHFHLNRDKMLLEDLGAGTTQGYGNNDDDSLSDPDEIYSLNLPPSSAKSPSPPPLTERKDRRNKRERPDYARLHRPKEDLTKKGRFGHEYDPEQDVVYPSSSEGEGEDGSGSEEDEGEEEEAPAAASEDEAASGGEEEGDEFAGDDRWAAAQYHATRNAPGEADSEDEEAAEMELEEARRLQKRARERLGRGDFLEEEDEEEERGEVGKEKEGRGRFEADDEGQSKEKKEGGKDKDVLPPSAAASLSAPEAIAHLLRTSPETLALVDDFVLTASKVKQVEKDLEVVRLGDGEGGEHPARAVMELEYQALTTYLPLLAFYFSLLLTPLPSRSPSHDQLVDQVLERLSGLRQSLATMEELELTSASYGGEEEEEEEDSEEGEDGGGGEEMGTRKGGKRGGRGRRGMLASEALDFAASLEDGSDDDLDLDDEDEDNEGEEITDSMLVGLEDDEVEELMGRLQPGEGAEELMKLVRARQREKGIEVGSEEDDEMRDEEDEEEVEEKPKAKKVQQQQAKKPKGIVVPALAPSTASSRPSKNPTKSSASASTGAAAASAADDYLDPLSLSHTDVLDKSTARKSLRFHVSQVAQKAQKREQRTRQGLEGDEEAPRRSKEAARRAVLQRQEHGAKKGAAEASRLDEGEFDAEDLRAAKAVRGESGASEDGDGDGGEDDDYYDLVSAEKQEGRKAKKARYDEARAAEKAEILSLAESSVDGPRQATRQILANKGLTPKRKKENRNARVKKRLRYDKAQKKLGSMKASYKGGEGKEGYSGESGGITRRNVKSRKLG